MVINYYDPAKRVYLALQMDMICDCQYDWRRLNNIDYTNFPDAMNMLTYIIIGGHDCYVSTSYLFNLNKW